MNKIKLEITDKLELVALVPSIVNSVYPDTTIEVKNWKDFSKYKLELILNRKNVSSKSLELKKGKCEVSTNDFLNANEIVILISDETKSSEVRLNLEGLHFKAEVYVNETTDGYLRLLNSMLEKIVDLDARVQQLEIDSEKELL